MANITRLTIIKFIELLIVFVLLILHYNSYNAGDTFNSMITMTAFGGYLIILIGLFSGVVMGTPVNRRVDLFFTLVGCLLFFVAGILNVSFFQSYSASTSFRSTGLAKGVIAIIEGVLFLIDAVLTFRGES